MELWDIYDDDRRPLGRTRARGEPLKKGENHIVVVIWTVNSRGEILVTLRHPEKKAYPNTWENTGGAVLSGETSRQGAVRELFEETGITAAEDDLLLVDVLKDKNAFFDMYMIKRDLEIGDLTMQEGETSEARWVTVERLVEMATDGTLAAPIARRFLAAREKFRRNMEKVLGGDK